MVDCEVVTLYHPLAIGNPDLIVWAKLIDLPTIVFKKFEGIYLERFNEFRALDLIVELVGIVAVRLSCAAELLNSLKSINLKSINRS